MTAIKNVPWDHPSGEENGEAVFFGSHLVARTNLLLWFLNLPQIPICHTGCLHWFKKGGGQQLRQDFQNDEARSSADPLPSQKWFNW